MRTPQEKAFDAALDKAADARIAEMDAWHAVVDAALKSRHGPFEKVASTDTPTDLATALLRCQEVYKHAGAVRAAADNLLRRLVTEIG